MPGHQTADDHIDYLFKLVIVGDSGVGKTSLLLKYVDNVFSETFISTIGVDFKIRTLELDGKRVKLQIWDTAGQDRFRNIVSTFYRNAHAILIVYDVTDVRTLQNIPSWRAEIDRYGNDLAPQVLVGNKCDMSDKRTVTAEEAGAMAQRFQMCHLETSAKTSHNLDALFSDVTRGLMATVDSERTVPCPPTNPRLPPSHKVPVGGICNC